jgi:1,4-alpha-glucan branching enzyme
VQLLPIQEFATQHSAGYNGVDYFSPEMLYEAATEADLARYLEVVNGRDLRGCS